MPVHPRLSELHSTHTAWRRDLHAHPEMLYDTVRTAGFVADKLREFGCDEVVTGVGRVGVVGVIHGQSRVSDRVVGLRADMDALPINEDTGAAHASLNPGVMHACGHDGHTTMLLAAAQVLAETRNFDGSAVLIFQPAEEGGGGGKAMCDDGLMERFGIQEVYGMHNMPTLPVGSFAIRPGPFFASADEWIIEVTGRGGHAAMPHLTIDPTVVASHLTLALQTIASRTVDPMLPVVVSVTSFRTASDAFNVIPPSVELRGTVRALSAEAREIALRRVTEIATHTAATFGATATCREYKLGYPVTTNHPLETQHALTAARAIAGNEQVNANAPAVLGAEDFAFMLNERPGAYILTGNGDTANLHHPAYDFDDAAIPHGASFWIELIEQRLPLGS
ncbi:amidohydrolase [Actomonas aquatica]|uniref:Amidohydrolase n=1 Tax=Actomonas aquatica TaxID=2866162 RepID=A0ABZ1CBX7_9BACT|nr:amidohydrolase [Opitutus sp. WL0086]WRQ89189.1 amidohydrolase [Opitutus sp. WL0086]